MQGTISRHPRGTTAFEAVLTDGVAVPIAPEKPPKKNHHASPIRSIRTHIVMSQVPDQLCCSRDLAQVRHDLVRRTKRTGLRSGLRSDGPGGSSDPFGSRGDLHRAGPGSESRSSASSGSLVSSSATRQTENWNNNWQRSSPKCERKRQCNCSQNV